MAKLRTGFQKYEGETLVVKFITGLSSKMPKLRKESQKQEGQTLELKIINVLSKL